MVLGVESVACDLYHLGAFQEDVSACSVWRYCARVHRRLFRWLRGGYGRDADSDNVIQVRLSE